ncbi:hypothetical protein C8R44DRAFT_861648 [Mycena epipterygia]|nr:hypothetical protein C8R44DRAFT_861648 [Mycena epipterygia]
MSGALPAVAFIAFALALIPLALDWRSRNIPLLSIIGWLAISDLTYGINSAIWNGNVNIVVPVCLANERFPPATKIKIGAEVALPVCALALALQRQAFSRMVQSSQSPGLSKSRYFRLMFLTFLLGVWDALAISLTRASEYRTSAMDDMGRRAFRLLAHQPVSHGSCPQRRAGVAILQLGFCRPRSLMLSVPNSRPNDFNSVLMTMGIKKSLIQLFPNRRRFVRGALKRQVRRSKSSTISAASATAELYISNIISGIVVYVSSALFLAAHAAPVPEDATALSARAGSDVFVELAVREPQEAVPADIEGDNKEITGDRSSGTSGCVIA